MPIQLASFLLPRNGGTWYLLEDRYLKGGLRVCADVTELNAIHASSLKVGMLVLLQSDNKLHQLKSLSPRVWELYTPDSGGGTSAQFYTHEQEIATDTWMVGHNKNNRNFTITIFDTDGEMIWPDSVKVVDENIVEIKFAAALDGYCVLGFDNS